jgi:hypothetical protein
LDNYSVENIEKIIIEVKEHRETLKGGMDKKTLRKRLDLGEKTMLYSMDNYK